MRYKFLLICLLLFFAICYNAFSLDIVKTPDSGKVYKNNVVASYYADKFHGRKTANGEFFNMYDFTAAHKTLPFGTVLEVTNLANGKTVIVRVNDRGPFIKGREIDLSKAAAQKLQMISSGTAKVKLVIIGTSGSSEYKSQTKKSANTKYLIQLGSFSSEANAYELVKKLRSHGFEPMYEKINNNKTIRVVIPHVSTSQLDSYKKSLQKAGFKNYLIRQE